MKKDPKPWAEMTNAEKKALSAQLRDEMRSSRPLPNDNSLEILRCALEREAGGHSLH